MAPPARGPGGALGLAVQVHSLSRQKASADGESKSIRKRNSSRIPLPSSGKGASGAGKERIKHALDNYCDSVRVVGIGNGHIVYGVWLDPHTAAHCSSHAVVPAHAGTAGRVVDRTAPINRK